jgi:hypothetical protein
MDYSSITGYGFFMNNNPDLYHRLYYLIDNEQEGEKYTIMIKDKPITICFESYYNEDCDCFCIFLESTKHETIFANNEFCKYTNVCNPSSKDICDFQLYIDYVKDNYDIDLYDEFVNLPSTFIFQVKKPVSEYYNIEY